MAQTPNDQSTSQAGRSRRTNHKEELFLLHGHSARSTSCDSQTARLSSRGLCAAQKSIDLSRTRTCNRVSYQPLRRCVAIGRRCRACMFDAPATIEFSLLKHTGSASSEQGRAAHSLSISHIVARFHMVNVEKGGEHSQRLQTRALPI